jgi:hypothetical protein
MAEVVHGYAAYHRALSADMPKAMRREVRAAFTVVGEEIRRDWTQKFSDYGNAAVGASRYGGTRASHTDSAQGYKVKVRKRGISVEQTKPKTTGLHPEYAGAQVKHGRDPATDGKERKLVAAMDNALDQVERIFARGH